MDDLQPGRRDDRDPAETYVFSGIATLESSSADDTLVGPGGGGTWAIDGNGSGTLTPTGVSNAIGFIAFKTLTGEGTNTLDAPGWTSSGAGSGTVAGASFSDMGTIVSTTVATFTYYGAAGGDDTPTIESLSGANGIQNEITGGAFGTVEFSDPTTELVVDLGGNDNTVTFQSLDSHVPDLSINAGTGTGNTLGGPSSPSGTFEITTDGAGDGTLAGSAAYTYTGFQTVAGGSTNDELVGPSDQNDPTDWTLTGAGTPSGTVDGTLGTVMFENFGKLLGTSGIDTLTGPATPETWTLSGTGVGTVLGASFSGFVSITGGSGADTLRGPAGGGTFAITGNDSGTLDSTAWSGFTQLTGQGGGNTLFEPCPGTPSPGSGTCDGIAYSGMQTVSDQAPSTYTFDGTSGNDTITVSADPGTPGYMQIVDNGVTTDFADPTLALVIEGKGGTDSITADSLDAAFNASLEIFGDVAVNLAPKTLTETNATTKLEDVYQISLLASDDTSVTIAGDLALGTGDLEVLTNTFTINSSVTISTTGFITVFAQNLGLAVQDDLPVLVTNKDASISIGNGVSLTAANIELFAYSSDVASLVTAIDMQTGGAAPNAAGTVIQELISHLGQLPISVLVKQATTSVTVGSNTTIDATNGSIEILSGANVAAIANPTSSFFTFGFAQAEATATVDVETGALLEATGAVDVLADGTANASMKAATNRYLGQSPPDPTQTSISIAATNAELTATATLAAGARIIAGTTANFRATGTITSSASGSAGSYNNGTVGIGIGLDFSSATVNTDVQGAITADVGPGSGVKLMIDPTVTCSAATVASDESACPIGYWNPANWTIVVGPNSLQTGQAVTYSNGGGVSIGGPIEGLINNMTYYVIRIAGEPDLIQLATTFTNAVQGAGYEFGSDYISLPSADITSDITKTFSASDINAATNQITVSLDQATGSGLDFTLFGAALAEGQPVEYVDLGGPGIPGLVSGQIYYADPIETEFNPSGSSVLLPGGRQVVALSLTYSAAEAGTAIPLGCAAGATASEPCGGSGYELIVVHVLDSGEADGVGVISSLSATDDASGSASLSDQSTGKIQSLKNGIHTATQPIADRLFQALAWKLSTYLGQGKDMETTKQSVAVAGAFAFTYANHNASVTIGSSAVLNSGGQLYAETSLTESLQQSATSSISGTAAMRNKMGADTEESQHKTSISVGLSIADVSNTALVTIDPGATLNASNDMLIYSEIEYPILTNLSNLPGSVGELFGALQNGSAISEISGIIGGNLGLTSFLNGFSNATAQAEKLAIAGSTTLFFLTNDAEANVDSGVLINQCTATCVAPAGVDQTVVVEGETVEQLISISGTLKTVASLIAINPVGSSSKSGGFGGAIDGTVLNNTTKAYVAPGVKIATGVDGGVDVEAEEYVMLLQFSAAGASADSTAISGSLSLIDQTSNTIAQIDSGVTITGGPVDVAADSLETVIDGAGDVVTGHGSGLGVSVDVTLVNRTTEAVIGALDLGAPGNGGGVVGSGGVNIDVNGPVTVSATNTGALWAFAVAGTIATKQKGDKDEDALAMAPPKALKLLGATSMSNNQPQEETGIAFAGAAEASIVTDATLAYVNDLGAIDAGSGAVSVTASQSTDLAGGTGALAINTGTGSKTNLALAGALSLDIVNDTTEAEVIGVAIPAAGGLQISASRTGTLDMATIGAAGSTASGRSIGIAGSVSWQQITATTEALLAGVVATLSGDASVTASDTTSEISIAGAGAYGGQVGVGAALGLNEITQNTEAIVEPLTVGQTTTDPSLTLGGGYTQSSTDGIDVIAVGLSAGIGQSAVAATIAVNLGSTSAQSTVTDATITANGGDIEISSTDNSTIDVGVGALALGVLQPSKDSNSAGNSNNTHVAIGISIAVNSIEQDVPATVTGSTLSASGNIEVTASATGTIYAVGVAGGATFKGSGSSGGFQFAGAGVVMVNDISGDITAEITGGSLTTTGTGEIDVQATDGTSINADSGAAGLLISLSESPASVAVGAAVSVNQDTRTIQASTDGTTLDSGGAIDIASASTASITTWALGIAGAITSGGSSGFTFAGAGSGAGSTVGQNVYAMITGGSVIAANALSVTATDGTTIDTQAGGVSFVLARGPPNAVAIGLAVAVNEVTDNVTAEINGASSVSAATLSITATESASIHSWTIAGGGSVSAGGSGSGASFNGAGAGSGNTITDTVLATLSDVPLVTLTDATTVATISASDTSEVFAVAGSAAFGVRISSSGGANISIGAAVAVNTIDNSTMATVDSVGSQANPFAAPGGLTVSATESAAVVAITVGVAGSVSAGSGGGVAFAGAGSGSGNTITTDTEAHITNSVVSVAPPAPPMGTPPANDVTVTAADTTSIEAIAGALGLSGKFGGGSNASVAVGLSVAASSITPTTIAEVSGSSITATGAITVTANSLDSAAAPATPSYYPPSASPFSPGIYAYALGGAVAVAAGSSTNITGAVGGAISLNTIGGSTEALIDNVGSAQGSTISAGGALTVQASDQRTINALTIAGAVSVSAGSSTSVGISIGLAIAQNTISGTLRSSITSSDITGARECLGDRHQQRLDHFDVERGRRVGGRRLERGRARRRRRGVAERDPRHEQRLCPEQHDRHERRTGRPGHDQPPRAPARSRRSCSRSPPASRSETRPASGSRSGSRWPAT